MTAAASSFCYILFIDLHGIAGRLVPSSSLSSRGLLIVYAWRHKELRKDIEYALGDLLSLIGLSFFQVG